MMSSLVYIENETGDKAIGAYFMQHDTIYVPQSCFHMKLSWIFANGPQIS